MPATTTAEASLFKTIRDHVDDADVLLHEIVKPLMAELRGARQCARVLAHAYDHDSTPPPWALELARGWNAYGMPVEASELGKMLPEPAAAFPPQADVPCRKTSS